MESTTVNAGTAETFIWTVHVETWRRHELSLANFKALVLSNNHSSTTVSQSARHFLQTKVKPFHVNSTGFSILSHSDDTCVEVV